MCSKRTLGRRFGHFLAGLLFALALTTVYGSEVETRRIEIGVNIFPKLLAVDLDLKRKLRDEQTAVIAVTYETDEASAVRWQGFLEKKIDQIAGYNVKIEAMDAKSFSNANRKISGILIVERLSDSSFNAVVEYATTYSILAFSPLPGDVERGASAGIAITSRITPFFNMDTLDKSGIRIHPMLLNISKKTQ